MAKVHIALVGGQPMPVYQGIEHCVPDEICLVCSRSTLATAEQIKSIYKRTTNVIVVSDDNLSDMQDKFFGLLQLYKQYEVVSLNLSGGLKIWAVLLSKMIPTILPHASVLCIAQDGQVFDLSNPKDKLYAKFNMDKQFELLGQKGNVEWDTLTNYDEEDDKVCDLIKKMYWDDKRIVALMDQFVKEFEKEFRKKFSYETTNSYRCVFDGNFDYYVEWKPNDREFELMWAGIPYFLSSTMADVLLLNTGWFEYDVARAFAELYGREKVHLSTIFKSANKKDKNEVDVIVELGQRLLFVECKTQISKPTDINKFANVVKTYGGLGTQALFVTASPMTADQLEKCKDSSVRTFTIYDNNHRVKKEELKKLCDEISHTWNTK